MVLAQTANLKQTYAVDQVRHLSTCGNVIQYTVHRQIIVRHEYEQFLELLADPPGVFNADSQDGCTCFNVRMHTSDVEHQQLLQLYWWAAATATMSVRLAAKLPCRGCEPWQHHAICLSVKTVRGPLRAEHQEWKDPKQNDGFQDCSF